MEVDTFTSSLGSDHDLGVGFEFMFGSKTVVHVHLPVNGDDFVTPGFQLFHQIVHRIAEFGEDEQLTLAQIGQNVIAQLDQLAFNFLLAHFVCLGNEVL